MNWSRIFIGDICTVVCFLSGKLNSIFDGIYIMNGLKVLHHTNTNLLELIVRVSFFKAKCSNCLRAVQRTLFSMKSPWWIIRGIFKIPHYMIFSLKPEAEKMENHEEWKEFTIWNTRTVDMVGCSLCDVKHEKRKS